MHQITKILLVTHGAPPKSFIKIRQLFQLSCDQTDKRTYTQPVKHSFLGGGKTVGRSPFGHCHDEKFVNQKHKIS